MVGTVRIRGSRGGRYEMTGEIREGWEMMCVSLCVVGVSSLCLLGVREESLCDIEGVRQREKGRRRQRVYGFIVHGLC